MHQIGLPANRGERRARGATLALHWNDTAAGPPQAWVRVIQRLLALNAAIWHNWLIGAPVKRSLIA